MPPFIPVKRSVSPESGQQAEPPAKRQSTKRQKAIEPSESSASSDEEQSEPEWEDVDNGASKPNQNDDDDDDDDDGSDGDEDRDGDDIDWEDAMATTTTTTPGGPTPIGDLELTLDSLADAASPTLLDTKKGPSKIERAIRLNTHRLHVQCLLFHNALRNAWINDSNVHDILRKQLPEGIKKEIQRWRVASGLEAPPQYSNTKTKGDRKGKKKQTQSSSKDWGDSAERLEPGQPDMSHGDPILQLLRVLAAYWKKNFKITAPGLRKHGYRSAKNVEQILKSFRDAETDSTLHGERIPNRDAFRASADMRQGSRDVAAQLFTALLRALGIEARLVSNLQPLGFAWTKAEVDTSELTKQESKTQRNATDSNEDSDSDSEQEITSTKRTSRGKVYDRDLPFPVYWTEAVSPVTHHVIPVDAMVLANQVAATPEMVAAFEPRGARADKAKQVIAYVVAHSPDGTAKDVTTRYLKRQTWPGKTKGYRLPPEKLVGRFSKEGPDFTFDYDWFKITMKGYERPANKRTIADDVEDAKDLVPNQPEKKPVKKEGDTLQSLKASTEFVLERFLRREEALRPGAQVVRKFSSGKGDKAKEENVYRRADVLRCLSAESWHKEGRQPRMGEVPLKQVPIRAVTLMRKREVDLAHRQTGQKPLQGLYAQYQTEYIIPPPIQNGVIPKNEYGNIDCFVPSMVPRGAVHIPFRGTVRICKKLGIDFAEAVTGFEFGSKMAVPVIEGVVVAEENGDLLKDAWRADQEARRERERLAQEKRILQTWRKFLMGLRITERVRAEYGEDGDAEVDNPFQRRGQNTQPAETSGSAQQLNNEYGQTHGYEVSDNDYHDDADNVDQGGGFLLPGEDDGEDNLIVDHGESSARQSVIVPDYQESDMSGVEISGENLEEQIEEEGEEDEEDEEDEEEEAYKPAPRTSARRRRRGGFALVNLKPILPGHVLVSPRRRVPRVSDLTADETADLFLTVRKVGRMIERVFGASSLNIAIQDGIDAGQSVAHVHTHIIPRRKADLDHKGGTDAIYGMLDGEEGDMGKIQRQLLKVAENDDNDERKGGSRRRTDFPAVDNEARTPRSDEDMEREAQMLAKEMERENDD
ncbi:DNA repair protein rhp42 [Talaromyces islandicus]|uniref:DNA repair protein rhp42 n=1 Tax=Talaromyces islandicus TaxID=28573 RepID=A0A0U1LU60_TALIS|nr:DNA repair protein rhp42 [Talaromyces islandicus]